MAYFIELCSKFWNNILKLLISFLQGSVLYESFRFRRKKTYKLFCFTFIYSVFSELNKAEIQMRRVNIKTALKLIERKYSWAWVIYNFVQPIMCATIWTTISVPVCDCISPALTPSLSTITCSVEIWINIEINIVFTRNLFRHYNVIYLLLNSKSACLSVRQS